MDIKIRDFLKQGKISFFLGAGISMIPPSCLPSWWQINHAILDSLADEASAIVPEVRELSEVIKKREEEGKLPPEFVAEIITNRIGKSYFEVLQVLEGDAPNKAHLWLATLAKAGFLKAIITTNFDTLIEQAFEITGVPLKVFVKPEEYEKVEEFNKSSDSCVLLKLHGTATHPDTCVDTLAQRKKGLDEEITQTLDYLGSNSFWIFLGYSGADLEAEPNYLGIRHRMNESPGFAWLHLPDREPLGVISELTHLYGKDRGLIEYGMLPDWLDDFKDLIPENIDIPPNLVYSDEEIQKMKIEKQDNIMKHARSWAESQGSAECSLILADITVEAGFYNLAQKVLLKLQDVKADFGLSPIGNALVCQLLGEISRRHGEMKNSLNYVQKAAKFFQQAGHNEGYFTSIQDIANLKWHFGYFEEAEQNINRYLDYNRKNKDYESLLHALLDLNNLYRETNQYQKAMKLLDEAIRIASEQGFEVLRAHSVLGKALIESELGDIEEAEKHALDASNVYTRLGNDNFLSESLRELSQIYFKRGNMQKAIELLDDAKHKAYIVGDKSRIARVESVQGDYLIKQGKYDEAVSILESSLEIAKELRDFVLIIIIMQNLGLAHQSQGNIKEAKRIYIEAIKKSENAGLDVKAAGIQNNLGIILEQTGELEKALNYYIKADGIFKRTGMLDSIAGSQGNIGNIHFRLGNYEEAKTHYAETLKISEKLQNIDGILRTQFNIANVALQSGDIEGAKIQYKQAIKLAKQYKQQGLKDTFQVNYAGLLFQLEDYSPAIELYKDSYTSSIGRNDFLQAGTAIYYAGLAYFRISDVENGIKSLEDSIESLKKLDEKPPTLNEALQTLKSIKDQLNL